MKKTGNWTVTIKSSYRELHFDFCDDSEAVNFANMAANNHRSDKDNYSVVFHATFADEPAKEETAEC